MEYRIVKADKMVLLKQKIQDEIEQLEAKRDDLHYYGGHQFDPVYDAQITALKWVLTTAGAL